MQAMGVDNPALERGEPLAPGFGSNARVIGGFITYRNLSIPIPELEGTSFAVTDGYITRAEGGALIANFKLRAPFEALQNINTELGLDSIDVASSDSFISTDPARPTNFSYIDEKDRRGPGTPMWVMGAREPLRTGVSIQQVTGYEAKGFLNAEDQVVGTFTGFVETASTFGRVRVTFDGDFNLQLKEVIAPPS